MAADVPSFDEFIKADRERRRNTAMAQAMLGRKPVAPKHGGSLIASASARVHKRVFQTSTYSHGPDHDWTHDLFPVIHSAPSTRRNPRNKAANRDLVRGFERAAQDPTWSHEHERIRGISIRGLAGPYYVVAQNFAPGTTTADIESAMSPVGGEMLSCRIVKLSPIMVVEMAFVSKEGADAVIREFNDKTADGRILQVYTKVGSYTPNPQPSYDAPAPPLRTSETQASNDDEVDHPTADSTSSAPNAALRDDRRGDSERSRDRGRERHSTYGRRYDYGDDDDNDNRFHRNYGRNIQPPQGPRRR